MPKICPTCNKEWPDEFNACPLDGATLIIKSQQPSHINLNLGDANAISGGVNMTDNHSVNNNTVNTTTSNVDSHNVITNHITQVERNKTAEELRHENELTYREECLKVYSKGIITAEEKGKLEDLQFRLGLDDVCTNKILSEVTKRTERKASSLSPVHQITFNNIKTAINANRLDLINRLMKQMKALVQRYSVEDIQFTYYMLQAVLHPEECAKEFESNYEDNYWQSFWSSIAYRRIGNIEKSEILVADVSDKWSDIVPQENVFILATVNALIDKDIDTAQSLFDNISGEYSLYLTNLISSLYSILFESTLSAEELKSYKKDAVFYSNNLFSGINLHISEKKHIEEAFVAERLAEEKPKQEVTEAKKLEEKSLEPQNSASNIQYDSKLCNSYINNFGYLRHLDSSEIPELKSMLLAAPKDDYRALFCLGQLYIQENSSAVNQKMAYEAIRVASEHGVYEAGAFMAYFFLYGKVVVEDLDEAEKRIKIDEDFKKNPLFVQMLVDLYTKKGNHMLAEVWKSKLTKL